MTKEEIKEVLGYRLYDILNVLALQMEDKNTTREEIIIKAFNTHTQQYNTLTVTLEE
jgi:hypothetical protein